MFYEVFQRLCAQYGKAETSVCREIGISATSPKQWREGREPTPATKKRIADYFKVDVQMFYEDFPEAPLYVPKSIPVQVITQEENELLSLIQKLPPKVKKALIALVREMVQ